MGSRTTVVNLRRHPHEIYIGRGSPFGNPFKISVNGDRETVIRKYRGYFYDKMLYDNDFKDKVHSLKGKILGCYCKPLTCHGDVIVEYLEGGQK